MNGWAELRVEGIEQSLANDVSWLAWVMSLVPPLFDAPAYSYPYVIKYACGWHSERIRKRERAHFEITLKSIWIPLALSSDLKSCCLSAITHVLQRSYSAAWLRSAGLLWRQPRTGQLERCRRSSTAASRNRWVIECLKWTRNGRLLIFIVI